MGQFGDFWRDAWSAGALLGYLGLLFAVIQILLSDEARTKLAASLKIYGVTFVAVALVTTVAISTLSMARGLTIGAAALIVAFGFELWRTRRLAGVERTLAESRSENGELVGANQKLVSDLAAAKAEIGELQGRLDVSIPYQKGTRGRWEAFDKIKYGHLAYAPLLDYDNAGLPRGLGVDLLQRLLGRVVDGKRVGIHPHHQSQTWGSVVDRLIAGDYDIVATPLFATFERSRRVAFTMPLFFSNVGLFVSKAYADQHSLENLTLCEMQARLTGLNDLKFLAVDEEISEKLGNKYRGDKPISVQSSKTILNLLFDQVAESAQDGTALAIFSESFYSHFNDKVKSGEIVNVLESHQLLYPVCFALRLGDYQLANLLNIRLLELAEKGGALTLLAEQLAHTGGITSDEVYDHFVAQWPFEAPDEKDVAHG